MIPEADSESLVSTFTSSNNDRKISCETLATNTSVKELPPDLPPESFYLSKEAEFEWLNKNAYLERKESAKGNMNPSSNSSSLRLSLSSTKGTSTTTAATTTFFGLPNGSNSIDSKRKSCKKPVNVRFFPTKRSESALKAVSAPEPVSPKVSCIGRVRSKKKNRRLIEAAKKCEKSFESKRKTGFYSRVFSMFRFGRSRSHIKPVKASMEKRNESTQEELVQSRKSYSVEPVSKPAGLGGMMKFKSGRRSGSWVAEEINVVVTGSGAQ